MKTLEKAQDKVKKIVDELRKEALEPAQEESKRILEKAKERAQEIIAQAEIEKAALLEQSKVAIEQERNVLHSSLDQAVKQGVESLRQAVERELFDSQLETYLAKETADPKIVAQLIEAISLAIQKEGLGANWSLTIAQTLKPETVAQFLGKNALEVLKSHPLEIGDFAGGVKLKLVNKNMTLDMSDEALRDLLARFVRKDFRKLLFKS